MRQKFILTADIDTENSLLIHTRQADTFGVRDGDRKMLRYGIASHPVRITVSAGISMHEVKLSQNIISILNIPLTSRYEIIATADEISIGPYIAFLLTQTKADFEKNMKYLSDYLYCYEEIGGTVAAFSLEGVNPGTQTIEGSIFNPETEQWDSGVYGYPASFFIKSNMIPYKYRKYFQSLMGNTLFNNFYYDKWQMCLLLQYSALKGYLLPGKRCKNPNDILSFLTRYKQIYFKPLHGSRGKEIVKIVKEDNGYAVFYRENNSNHEIRFADHEKLGEFIQKKLDKQPYMIQKAAQLISCQNRIIDFRIIMVKNEFGEWQDMGLFSRYGPAGSIVSNISAGGAAESGEQTLKRIFHLTDNELHQMRQQMSLLAYETAKCLDLAGVHCGNMGVDIGIDTDKHLWIIEIQHNNPDPTLVLDAGAGKTYLEILRNNMLYLKRLAGFAQEEERIGRDLL